MPAALLWHTKSKLVLCVWDVSGRSCPNGDVIRALSFWKSYTDNDDEIRSRGERAWLHCQMHTFRFARCRVEPKGGDKSRRAPIVRIDQSWRQLPAKLAIILFVWTYHSTCNKIFRALFRHLFQNCKMAEYAHYLCMSHKPWELISWAKNILILNSLERSSFISQIPPNSHPSIIASCQYEEGVLGGQFSAIRGTKLMIFSFLELQVQKGQY